MEFRKAGSGNLKLSEAPPKCKPLFLNHIVDLFPTGNWIEAIWFLITVSRINIIVKADKDKTGKDYL